MANEVVSHLLIRCSEWLGIELLQAYDVDDKVRSLKQTLEWVHAFLVDADEINYCQSSERAKLWVRQIVDRAHEAEDAVDNFTYIAEQCKTWNASKIVRDPRRRVAKNIDKIVKAMNETILNRSLFGIENLPVGGGIASASLGVEEEEEQVQVACVVAEEEDVVHMDDDTSLLAEVLIQETAERRHLVSIVGMAGIGKTTLAKAVYNHPEIMSNFECRAWVRVSRQCQAREILEGLVKCISSPGREDLELMGKMNENDLRQRLHQHLQEKIYLVVLDDVWRKEAWDRLAPAFPVQGTRSRVLLTTRLEDVALHAGGFIYKRGLLGEDDGWSLFCKKAFRKDDGFNKCPFELEGFGREILKKCHGLPLAIVALGKLLSTKGNLPSEWAKVSRIVNWELQEGEYQISRRLELSYHDLPYYVKPCFLYFAAFPEHYSIKKSTLTKLWIAEGFIRQRGEEAIEDSAEDCLNKLVRRNMVEVVELNCHGGVKKCRMHPLLWGLTISKAKEEKFLDVFGDHVEPMSPTKARRLVIKPDGSGKYIYLIKSAPTHFRSLFSFCQTHTIIEKDVCKFICGFKFLRILHLHSLSISHGSLDGIENLILLKYLGLMHSHRVRIPSTISKLHNLQTLDVRNNSNIDLPGDIWKFRQLRHVRADTANLKHVPAEYYHLVMRQFSGGILLPNNVEFSHLLKLQTLTGVRAGDWMNTGMAGLVNVRKLAIEGVTEEYSPLFSMYKLSCLRSLKLSTKDGCPFPSLSSFSDNPHLYAMYLDGALEKLIQPHQFPPLLTKLYLWNSNMKQDSLATLEMLPNLRTLVLHTGSYVGKKMIIISQGFQRLQVLQLDSVDEIEKLTVEEGAMPGLTHLAIRHCIRLMEISEGLISSRTSIQEFIFDGNAIELLNPRLQKKGTKGNSVK
ncbi:hypothetical protein AAC387_Pa07g1637 [Persea americana]